MEIINLKEHPDYLREYISLCALEWGKKRNEGETATYIAQKEKSIYSENKVISAIGLVNDNSLIGFISLFEYEDDISEDLTPWYATMYVKKEYRGKGYSKLLNDAILKEAKDLGYSKVYLKSSLKNYYEKFGAKFIKYLDNNEKVYYMDV